MQTPGSRVSPHGGQQPRQAAAPKPKLLDQVRVALRSRHYNGTSNRPLFIGSNAISFSIRYAIRLRC